jgi:acetolactate synthase-1/2/3 large subunit
MGAPTAAPENTSLTVSGTMRLADYLFARVRDEGLDAVFLVPGGGAMHLVDALGQNHDLRYVPTHHEQAAAIAAEAYSRINGHRDYRGYRCVDRVGAAACDFRTGQAR